MSSIFSNIYKYDQYVEISDLDNDIDANWKIIATPFSQRVYNWAMSDTLEFEPF